MGGIRDIKEVKLTLFENTIELKVMKFSQSLVSEIEDFEKLWIDRGGDLTGGF